MISNGDGNPNKALDSDGNGIPDFLQPNNTHPNDDLVIYNAVILDGPNP